MSTNTNSSPIFTDPRAKRWGAFAKWAMLLVACFFIAPYIWVAVGGLLGLITFTVIVGMSWMFRNTAYAMAANMRLKLIKTEAQKNPVETLQNDLREKSIALDNRKTSIQQLDGKIRTFEDKVNDLIKRYGKDSPDVVKLSKDLSNLRDIYEHRCRKWKEARKQLELYSEQIERAGMIWEAALAAAAARESSGLTEDEFYAKLRSETAFDAIQNGYNEALASLDTALETDNETTKK